jgi:hypothetical protein
MPCIRTITQTVDVLATYPNLDTDKTDDVSLAVSGVIATWPNLDTDKTDDKTTFLSLDDTPNSYAGEGGKYLAVNIGTTAVEFVPAPTFGDPYQSDPGFNTVTVTGHFTSLSDATIDGNLSSVDTILADDIMTTNSVSAGTSIVSSGISTAPTVSGIDIYGSRTIYGSLLEATTPGSGLILTAPNGNRWQLTVNNVGNLVMTEI